MVVSRGAIALGFIAGILLCAQPADRAYRPARTVQAVRATAVADAAAVHIMRYNKDMPIGRACELYRTISRAVHDMSAGDKSGVVSNITPELCLALILVESGARNSTSAKGAVGMAQVMPLHIESLKAAGILRKGSVSELRETENNIRAGVYILMGYARTARSVESALARYNAGVKGESRGYRYAKKVLALYREII